MKKIILLLPLLLFLDIISGHAADNLSDNLDAMHRIDKFVWEGATFLPKKPSLTDLRNLPGFKNELTSKEPNRHNPKIQDEFKTFEYDGLKIYGFVSNSEVLWPITIQISKPQWKVLHELNVGSSIMEVYKVLGQPTNSENNISEYVGETERVQFYKKDNKISEIRFFIYFD